MKLKKVVESNNWLSVEMTLIKLYPNQIELINDYRNVFEKLQYLKPEANDMLIVLTEYLENFEENSDVENTYVDVSGRKLVIEENSFSNSYAIEFVKWEKWLGMELAPETLENFNELEIIAHCLFEMIFFGYEEEEIQEQFESINDKIEDYKAFSEIEKKEKTISIDEIIEKNKNNGSC